jgi:uncharacterized protein
MPYWHISYYQTISKEENCMNKRLFKVFSLITILALMLMALPIQKAQAISADVVISQVYGAGGNSGATYKNDFVELYNRGDNPVSLSGWSIQYASATGTGNFSGNPITNLSGTLQPGQYYLVWESGGVNGIALPTADATGTIAMAAGAGKVALVTSTTGLACNGSPGQPCSAAQLAQIKDLVGYGTANFFEGAGAAPVIGITTSDSRASAGCTDTDNNNADFSAGTISPRNTASLLHFCTADNAPFVAGTVPANGATEVPLNSGVTVTFSEAVNVTGSWFDLSCTSSGNHTATVSGGPNTFTLNPDTDFVQGENCTLTVYAANVTDQDSNDPPDNMVINFTAGFATIAPPLAIGTVNGPVSDADSGTAHVSPYVGQTVKVQGVIYETTLQAITNSTNSYKGFFIQNTSETADGDPNTSDGLFVFMSTSSTIDGPSGPYTPQVGDEVVLTGKVSEFFNMTELVAPLAVSTIVDSGLNIDTAVPALEANPPANLDDANRYWERLQGMRVQVPQDSIVLGGRNVFSPADAEIWLARADSTVGLRSDHYQRRAFRDAHPLDDNYDANNWDGNGYRMLIGSLGIKSAANNKDTLIDPARTFETLSAPVAGGLNYTFSKYRIEISGQPVFNEGPDPSANHAPQVPNRVTEYSIVDYNIENLYDYRDNPYSGCDFTGNSGCPKVAPFLSAVTPPYDYVPANEDVYKARIADIATEIINDLHSPDILMMQEVENQDFCSISNGALVCGISDNADGRPDDLQDLAVKIAELGGPTYDAAFDRNSSDLRGIVPSFMYRTDRVQLLPAAGDPILDGSPAIDGYSAVSYNSDTSNPKTLNAVYTGSGACETSYIFPRAPDIGLFRIHANAVGDANYRDVYVIDNHFKSGPDTCIAHRTEQANYNAAIVAFLQAAKPDVNIVLGGDLNVYPRPDDIAFGASDQLAALYNPSLGLKNLWEVELSQAPEAAYSYVFVGQAQTIDQVFVNQSMLGHLSDVRTAHINSDFPADYPGDVARGTSDHDPTATRFLFNLPPVVAAPTISPEPSTEGSSVTASASFSDPDGSSDGPFTCTVNYGDGSGNLPGVVTGSTCAGPSHAYTTFGLYTVTVNVTDKFGGTGSNTGTHTVIFNWAGFFQPVDNLPTLNVVKAGSAIPVKFGLGGNKGLNIFAAGYPKSQLVACDSTEPLDDIEQTVTAGSSSLTYDPLTGQYNYVWKTDKTWVGTCRQLVVKLIDGTVHYANFKFK